MFIFNNTKHKIAYDLTKKRSEKDIVEDRRLDNLIKYFYYYDYKTRNRVKFIIIDKFHLTQLISRALNKIRIKVMNNDKNNYRKFKITGD